MKYKAGCSGNPAGRPKGIVDRDRQRVIDLMKDRGFDPWEALLTIAVEEEDPGIRLKAILSLANMQIPARKPRSEPVVFDLDMEATPADQARSVVKAMSEGILSPDIGASIIASIKAVVEIAEGVELADVLIEWKDSQKGSKPWGDARR